MIVLFIVIRKKQIIMFFVYVLFISTSFYLFTKLSSTAPTFGVYTNQKVVVLDAGHGGWDPGKLGKHGADEKEINLKICEILRTYLEASGGFVVITRDGDYALSKTKNGDLRARKVLADSTNADIMISIHQNAYPSAKVKGAQVFYHEKSEKGKILATSIQTKVKEFIDTDNKRGPDANSNYYVIKNTTIPAVIVECGFLSNWSDEKKLNTEAYQEKIAWGIYLGINDYFEKLEQGNIQ